MRLDGTITYRPGYDKETGLLLLIDDPASLPVIPTEPDQHDVAAAYQTLMEPFEAFSFEEPDRDRALLLTALLTAVVRKTLPTAPGFLISSTTAGSGKTKMAQCIEILAGGDGGTMSFPYDKDEMRKVIMGAMLQSSPSILFDNLSHNPKSDLLCAVLSSPTHSERILGTKDMARLPTQMMFIMTGNNLHASGDLSRRTLRIALDPRCENPWKRKFSFDPVTMVRKNRYELTAAALTILRGYFAAGCPKVLENNTGSYEDWSRIVRATVTWHTGIDPEVSIEDNYVNDDETDTLQQLMFLWKDVFGDQVVMNNEIAAVMNATSGFEDDATIALRDHILNEVMVYMNSRPTVNGFTRWLGYRKGRVLENMQFDKYRDKHQRGWQLVSLINGFDLDAFFDN